MASIAHDPLIRISVPEDVLDLVPRFLSNRRKDLAGFREEAASGDRAALLFRAHTVKGSAGGFGFQTLSELAAEMEAEVRAGNLAGVDPLIDRMEAYLDHVEVVPE